ncbi:MAG: acyltransferase [Flavihumibacter sp.]
MKPPLAVASRHYDWIDYAKFFAIVKVVCLHVINGMYQSGYHETHHALLLVKTLDASMMPLLFMISGITVQQSLDKRGLAGFTRNKVATVLYPYLVWSLIQLSFQVFAWKLNYANQPKHLAGISGILYSPHDSDQFWFLYVLFLCLLLYAFMVSYLKFSMRLLLVFSAVLLVLFYYMPVHFNVFAIRTVFKFLFYVALGAALSNYLTSAQAAGRLSRWSTLVLAGIPFFLLHTCIYYFHITLPEQAFFSATNLLRLLATASGISFVLVLSFVLAKRRLFGWMPAIGKKTLYIFCLHIIVFGGLRLLVVKGFHGGGDPVSMLVLLGGSLLIPMLLQQLLQKLGFNFLFRYYEESAKTTIIAANPRPV